MSTADTPLDFEKLEQSFFRTLNSVVEPAVRRGFASPCLQPNGLVVLETTGHRSRKLRRTPLAATRLGRRILVSTFRADRSHWIRNLEEEPRGAVWISGKRCAINASVLNAERASDELIARGLPQSLSQPITRGWGFAILTLVA